MTITIYHNPRCSNSRGALELIRAAGHEPVIIDYVANLPPRETIAAMIRAAGLTVREAMRSKEPAFIDLGLDELFVGDDALLDGIVAHPTLLNRPFVVTPRGTRLCRPPELVLALLPE
jgi:arsenate reductase